VRIFKNEDWTIGEVATLVLEFSHSALLAYQQKHCQPHQKQMPNDNIAQGCQQDEHSKYLQVDKSKATLDRKLFDHILQNKGSKPSLPTFETRI
jgi:hypothetical protein